MVETEIILIVDDNDVDIQTYKRFLKKNSHQIAYRLIVAYNGAQGLVAYQEHQVTCILLDYQLPDMTGLEFLDQLQAQGPLKAPVVMLTGQGNEVVAVQTMQKGAHDYLVKNNITASSLLRIISNSLEKFRVQQLVIAQQQALERKNRELESFSYTVAHDLRQPLRGIHNYASELYELIKPQGGPIEQGYLEYIIHASQRMGHMVDDLLTYAQLGEGSIEFDLIALSDLLPHVKADLTARITEKQAEIIISPELPTVYGNSTFLGQIFTNLLNNAMNYHRPDLPPVITVSAQKELNGYIVQVSDNGVGIPPEAHEKVFNLFQRLHGGKQHPGSGIGLATVKKLMERLGGQVWLASTVGEGTTFFLKFPYQLHHAL